MMHMSFDEYQALARRTQNTELTKDERINHALLGIAAEAGEICGIYQKKYQGHRVYFGDVAKELGDLLWFCAELADCLDVGLGAVATANIEKLKIRYPSGYTAKDSLERRDMHVEEPHPL
jgi:NTP pyrophosphatase (non-canonical NTP hydrolase)